jgi:hypothetical protein
MGDEEVQVLVVDLPSSTISNWDDLEKLLHHVCVMWCVVCGVWCVVCGVWCVVCGVWCVVCGVWCVVCGVWPSIHSIPKWYLCTSRTYNVILQAKLMY